MLDLYSIPISQQSVLRSSKRALSSQSGRSPVYTTMARNPSRPASCPNKDQIERTV
ncbi:hypothetical protein BCR34DRAFT_574248 [Clohesyomyces aquaticus]|uniref:Uncharacterized protein n=1 Tax=Clohesyomyces aquaticus TaxID=1231657 RepID=A0A1Y1YWD1_9PLEO|nr:hypothetical protein BCR34DRAFT_574248 [Clohesyomyces aquaticus]